MSELADTFLPKLATVLTDLKTTGQDEQIMMRLGSLAQELIETGQSTNWTAFKAGLGPQAYDELLGSLERNGKKLLAKGNKKGAYVIQTAAVSLIAGRMAADERIAGGNALLDNMINRCAERYRLARASLN